MGCINSQPRPDPVESLKSDKKKNPSLEQGVKIVLLGDAATGKTCLVGRVLQNKFLQETSGTVGAAFQVFKTLVDGREIKLEIWDTAGQERFRSLAPMYYRGAVAAIVVYDITRKETFDVMRRWIDELNTAASANIIIAIAGNKLDLAEKRAIPTATAEDYVLEMKQEGMRPPIFIECSAKTGENVSSMINQICKQLIVLSDQGLLV